MKTFVTLILIHSLSLANATDLEEIYKGVAEVESNSISTAIGDGGKAYGILQIHKICVDDVNRLYGTTFTHKDAFDINKSKKIFILYLKAGIKRYVKRYSRQPTEEEIVRMWNGGIYQGYKIKDTIKYYKKYEKSTRKRKQSA